jgi:hypothetical protein
MVNISKKLSNIAFQNPTGFRIVLADFICKFTKSIDGFVGAFVVPAGI